MTSEQIAKVFKAFCDERRIDIIKLLSTGEKCGCKLLEELNISQPTLSHHMKILCDAGIVIPRKEGKWTHYRIDEDGSKKTIEILMTLVDVKEDLNKNSYCR